MLSAEQRREILAVALLAVAVFLILSLLPVDLFGRRGLEWFPSGNMMGIVGGTVDGLLMAFLGGTAYLVPFLIALGGLRLAGWVDPGLALRVGVLGVGLLALLPTAVWVTVARPAPSGWLGTNLGGPLVGLMGWLGAILVCGVGLVALSVGTLGWNPLRSMGRGTRPRSRVRRRPRIRSAGTTRWCSRRGRRPGPRRRPGRWGSTPRPTPALARTPPPTPGRPTTQMDSRTPTRPTARTTKSPRSTC